MFSTFLAIHILLHPGEMQHLPCLSRGPNTRGHVDNRVVVPHVQHVSEMILCAPVQAAVSVCRNTELNCLIFSSSLTVPQEFFTVFSSGCNELDFLGNTG